VNNYGALDVGDVNSGAVLTLDDGTSLNGGTIGTLFINSGSSATFDDASVSAATITVGYEQPFSTLEGVSGNEGTYALGINDNGEIVGYFYDSSENVHGYILGDGNFTQIDDPSANTANGQGTYASGIDNDGTIVGYYFGADDAFHGFVATPGNGSYASGTIVQLDDPSADNDYFGGTYATAINAGANGAGPEVVGYYYDDIGMAHGFVYTGSFTSIDNSDFTTIDDPNVGASGGTYLTGINDSGEVVGYYIDSGGMHHGFTAMPTSDGVYEANAFTDINDPNAGNFGTYATGINDAGEVVGYYYDGNNDLHGFLYEDGVYIDLNDPSAADGTYATAINNSGQVVGYYEDDGFNGFAVATPTTLTLTDGTVMSGDTLAINPGSLVAIEQPNSQGDSATFDDVQVDNAGTIQVDDAFSISSLTLILSDGTGVTGGVISIGSLGILDVEGGSIPDVTLDGVNVDSNNSIEVGVSSDVTFTLDDGTKFEGGSLTINSGSTLDVEYGSNSFSGAAGAALDNVSVSGSGTILVDSEGNGADLALGGDTLVTGALLSIAALGAIEIGADVSGDGYVSPTLTNLTADNAGTIQIEPNATLLIGGTVTLNGGGTVELMTATEEFAGAIAGAGTGTLDNHNNTIIADGFGTGIGLGDQSLTFINESGGTVDADGNDSANNNNDVSIAINTGNAVTNQGVFEATNGGTLFIDDALNNSGTVLADGGTVVFSLGASVSLANIGSGAVQIAGGGVVEFLGPTDDQPDVTFAGPGTLEAASYHGTIIGFGTGDAIDLLDDVTYTAGQTVDWTQVTTGTDAGGILQLYNSSHTLEATLDLTGNYSQDDFAPVPDSSSSDAGTEVVFSLPDYTFITDFTKNNNIQADLIKEFPTGQFTANDSLATPFDIASDSNGNNYYDGFTNGGALTIDVSISDVTNVYTLMNAYSPGSGFETATVEFIATGGVTETFELVNGDNIRDFFQGDYANTLNNTPISDPSAENAFSITTTGTDGGGTGNTSTGSSGTYNIDEQDFALSSAFASQTLTEIVITDLGGARGGSDVPALLGITAESGSVSTDPIVVPGTSDVVGNIAFTDSDSPNTIDASFAPEGSNYVGSFALDPVAVSNGSVSVGFEFSLGNDQINFAPGETLTQSYGISITDAQNPAANVNQTVSVSIGGPGNDNFVFAPGIGADTITNFNPQQDTIELDHFANAQTVQELQSLITTDAHGDAVINLGHNDSITLPGVTAPQVQQVILAGHVLLH